MSLLKSIKIELVRVNARLISATTSCGSIYVVYGFHPIPITSTKLFEIFNQSRSGYAHKWAFKFPVAPLNFPKMVILSMFSICLLILYAKFANSLPTVLGVALYPWVLHIIGMSAYSTASFSRRSWRLLRVGSMTSVIEWWSINA